MRLLNPPAEDMIKIPVIILSQPSFEDLRIFRNGLAFQLLSISMIFCAFTNFSNALRREGIDAENSAGQQMLHNDAIEKQPSADDAQGTANKPSTRGTEDSQGSAKTLAKSAPKPRPHLRFNIGYLFDDSYLDEDDEEELRQGVRLTIDSLFTSSNLDYMGRVEVALPGKIWGTICGDEWTVEDATVVCRQLGLEVSNVIAPRRGDFGSGRKKVALSQVRCRGDELSIQDCPAVRGDGITPLPCSNHLRGAAAICGCSPTASPEPQSRCFLYTGYFRNSLTCYHSCPDKQILVGDRRRECVKNQQWTGVEPQCTEVQESRAICKISSQFRAPCLRPTLDTSGMRGDFPKSALASAKTCIASGCCYNASSSPPCYLPVNSPCMNKPCKNGGRCQDRLGSETEYTCVCAGKFGGHNCEQENNWSCGRQKIKPNLVSVKPFHKIRGGRKAKNGSWPWVVQIKYNGTYICAGALIHRHWILTAAHCMAAKNATIGYNHDKLWSVSVGRHSAVDTTRGEDINVSFMTHNNYTNETIPIHDIALFKLAMPVAINKFADILCLPRDRNESPKPGTKCWVAGWGSTNSHVEMAEILYQADIPIISNQKCRDKKDYDNFYHMLTNDMMCAAYKDGGVDSCEGDSGGPMMCQRRGGTWYVAGIVSWGYACADPDSPGVYTRVSHYLNWIYSNIANG